MFDPSSGTGVLSLDDPVGEKIACLQCQAVLEASDNYCRHCGAPASSAAEAATSPVKFSYWESPWLVLTLLFLVLGPLAIPLLWRSRRFTLLWKGILTALVLGLSALLAWNLWLAVQQALGSWRRCKSFSSTSRSTRLN